MLQPVWTADRAAATRSSRMTGTPRCGSGIVCPYSLDVPGGVQCHVRRPRRGAARARATPSRCSPRPTTTRPSGVRHPGRAGAGRAVQRLGGPGDVRAGVLRPGPPLARRERLRRPAPARAHRRSACRCWLCMVAEGPIVATFHTATERSRALQRVRGLARPLMEKVTARIAVSPLARRVQVEHLGGDAVEIPNGVDVAAFARGPLLPGYPRPRPDDRLPRAVRRAAQGDAGAARRAAARSRRTGPTCGCSSSAGATPTRCAGPPDRRGRRASTSSGAVDDATRRPRCARSTLLRAATWAGRASGWS